MRTDICEGCVCDKFLQMNRFQCSGLRACKFHSLFYFTGSFPFFVSGFHNDFKGSVIVYGECCEISLTTHLCDNLSYHHGIRDFRKPRGLYTDSFFAKEMVSIT